MRKRVVLTLSSVLLIFAIGYKSCVRGNQNRQESVVMTQTQTAGQQQSSGAVSLLPPGTTGAVQASGSSAFMEMAEKYMFKPKDSQQKMLPSQTPTAFLADGKIKLEINGTNDQLPSPERLKSWYHSPVPEIVLDENEKVLIQCQNPDLWLGFTAWKDKESATPVWGRPRTLIAAYEERPRYGNQTFGALYALLLELQSENEIASKTFTENQPYFVLQNRSRKARLVFHRNLINTYVSINDLLPGEDPNNLSQERLDRVIRNDGFGWSSYSDPPGQDYWVILVTRHFQ